METSTPLDVPEPIDFTFWALGEYIIVEPRTVGARTFLMDQMEGAHYLCVPLCKLSQVTSMFSDHDLSMANTSAGLH